MFLAPITHCKHLFAFLVIALFYLANVFLNWPLLVWSNTKGPEDFGDLLIVIEAANCTDSDNLYNRLNQDGNCEFVYGSFLLRIIYFFRLQHLDSSVLGLSLIFLTILGYMFILSAITKKPSWKFRICSIMLFCSPPIMLLFERGNIDSVIFLLVVSCSIAFSKSQYLLAYISISIASLIKFYTFPLLILIIILSKPNRSRLFIMIPSSVLILSQILFDLARILEDTRIPNPTSTAFGSPVFGLVLNKIFGFEISRLGQLLFGFVIGLIGLLLIGSISKFKIQLSQMKNRVATLPSESFKIFIFFSISYIILMFTGMNFVYRLVIALPAFLILLMLQTKNQYFLNTNIFGGVWISYQFENFELIGDLMLFFLALLLVRLIPYKRLFAERHITTT